MWIEQPKTTMCTVAYKNIEEPVPKSKTVMCVQGTVFVLWHLTTLNVQHA